MAWTAPRTWVTGEVVTAALLNTHIRDNMNVLNPNSFTYIHAPGGAITAGSITFQRFPYAACLQIVEAVTDGASPVELLFAKDSYANFPPASTGGTVIHGSSPLNTGCARKNQITTLTTWAPSLADGDYVGLYIVAASGVTWSAITAEFNRT